MLSTLSRDRIRETTTENYPGLIRRTWTRPSSQRIYLTTESQSRCHEMRRWTFGLIAAASALFLSAPLSQAEGRVGFTFDYGSTSRTFGLSAPPYFTVPYQFNTSEDGIISGYLEGLITPRRQLELGIAVKGSLAFSQWNLGSPGVYDSMGFYYYPDDIHISANWWAAAVLATAHLHLGRSMAIDGAVGYGPYGYFNVSYQDDAGVVYGPVSQDPSAFPSRAWGIDWSAGLSFGVFRWVSVSLDVGMMGPDFVGGFGVSVPLA